MKSKLNYQIFLSRIARKQYKLHDIKKEWKIFILFVFLAKILTWSISIFAGTNYFKLLLLPVVQEKTLAITVAILILIIIEVLTTIALSKFFKFLYRGINHLSTIIALTIIVVGLFGVSFVSSTNGLSMRQAKKVDNTDLIVERFELKNVIIKDDYHNRFVGIDEQIETIKSNPQGWARGVRSTLISQQLAKIDSLQKRKAEIRQEQKNEIVEIDKQKQSEIRINTVQTTSEADKYYKIITVVMIIQFISSGILMFFWKRIFYEDDKDSVISEYAKEINDTMSANTFYMVQNYMSEAANSFALELDNASKKNKLALPVNEDIKLPDKEKERVEIAGFSNANKNKFKTGFKNTKKTTEPSIRIDSNEDFKGENLTKKNVDFLRKHKLIVKSIKLINLPEKQSISNNEIKQIKENAKKAKFKSKTLIREVFKVAVTVGFNNIDENGDIKRLRI